MSHIRFPRKNVAYSLVRLVVNQLLPLAVLPYLLRKLNADNFGLLMMAQAVGWYMVVFVEYGFNLTGVKRIAQIRSTPGDLPQALVEIETLRLLLAGVLAVGWSMAYLIFFESGSDFSLLVTVGFIAALGAALQPVWFFQGLEEFPLISAVQVLSRFLCLGSIFFLVQAPSDLLLAQLLLSLPFFLSAIILTPLAHRRFRLKKRQRLACLWNSSLVHLREGWSVFLSQMATTLFTSTNTLLLGALLNPSAAGHYTLGEKVIRGLALLTSPVTEAIYPRVASNINSHRQATLQFARKVLLVGSGVLVATGVAVILASPNIGRLLGGAEAAADIALTLAIMAFVPASIFANNICGTQVLLGLGYHKQFRNAIFIAGISVPLSSLLLVPLLGLPGAPMGVVIGELIILVLMVRWSLNAAKYNWITKSQGQAGHEHHG